MKTRKNHICFLFMLLMVTLSVVVLAEQHWIGTGERVGEWGDQLPADRVRIGVRDDGVYRVTFAEIAVASGNSEGVVRGLALSETLALYCGSESVAWEMDEDAIYFYGRATSELYAPENVYWLYLSEGVRMEYFAAHPELGSTTNAWFMSTRSYRSDFVAPYEARDRRSTNGSLTNVLNFGKWISASANEALRSQSRTVATPGAVVDAGVGGMVRAHVVSYKFDVYNYNHICEVYINGIKAGESSWINEKSVIFDAVLDAGVVDDESVEIKVRSGLASGGNSDFMLLDTWLSYPRYYQPTEGGLFCHGGSGESISIGGYASSDIFVWELSDPLQPVALGAEVVEVEAGCWSVAFASGDSSVPYVVFTPDECYEPSVSGVRDVEWSDPDEMPELAIIIPPRRWVSGFDAAVAPLAARRNAQGIRTRVIDAEEIYNAFTDGLVHPIAFRYFVGMGADNAKPMRYMLLAGNGGYDYKLDAFPLEVPSPFLNLLPTYMLYNTDGKAHLLIPAEMELGIPPGQNLPTATVGRYLATSAVQLSQMVAKTLKAENTADWRRRGVFVGDWDNQGAKYGLFSATATSVMESMEEAGWEGLPYMAWDSRPSVVMLWNGTWYDSNIESELYRGSGFFYYLGHSLDTLIGPAAGHEILKSSHIREGEWNNPPIAMIMGCRVSRWTTYDIKGNETGISVAAAGVKNPTSGFSAAYGSGGYISIGDAINFSLRFGSAVADGAACLGDALLSAMRGGGSGFVYNSRHLNLLGDPSMPIQPLITPTGVPVDWLVQQGLEGSPEDTDLGDQDGDGFPTWMEYLAGSDPKVGGIRITEFRYPVDGATAFMRVELRAGQDYMVLSSEDLNLPVWESVGWRFVGESSWRSDPISGEWPVVEIEVTTGGGGSEPRRFFKVRAVSN